MDDIPLSIRQSLVKNGPHIYQKMILLNDSRRARANRYHPNAVVPRARARMTVQKWRGRTTAILWMLKARRDLKPSELLVNTCGDKNCVSPDCCYVTDKSGCMSAAQGMRKKVRAKIGSINTTLLQSVLDGRGAGTDEYSEKGGDDSETMTPKTFGESDMEGDYFGEISDEDESSFRAYKNGKHGAPSNLTELRGDGGFDLAY